LIQVGPESKRLPVLVRQRKEVCGLDVAATLDEELLDLLKAHLPN
jgi:hypothetical protein